MTESTDYDYDSDRRLLANLIERARSTAVDIATALERLQHQTLENGAHPRPVSARVAEMAKIYRHLDRVRVDSLVVGVERP